MMMEKENIGPITKRIQEARESDEKKLRDLKLGTEEENLRKIDEELKNATEEEKERLKREKRETTRRIINLKEKTLKEWGSSVDGQIENIQSEIDKVIPKIRLYEVELNRAMIHANEQEMLKDTDKVNSLREKLNSLREEKASINKKIEEFQKTKEKLDSDAKIDFEQKEKNASEAKKELASEIESEIVNSQESEDKDAA